MEKRFLYSVVALLVCATVAAAASVDHSVFDKILRENVRNERVDYVGIKANWMQTLGGYLDLLAMVDVNKLPRDEQLAFYLNLYNATMIKALKMTAARMVSPSGTKRPTSKNKPPTSCIAPMT